MTATADWTAPDGWLVATDANGRTESPILTVRRHLERASSSQIAEVLGRTTGNVSTQLRQFEERGKVVRTGETVHGARGGPQVEFALMGAGGEMTSPATSVDPGPGPVEARVAALARQVARLSGDLERTENERDGAKARADQAEAKTREVERRLHAAEQRAGAADIEPERRQQLLDAQRRAREAEEANARLEAELQDARRGALAVADPNLVAERDALRGEVEELKGAVEFAKREVLECAGAITERDELRLRVRDMAEDIALLEGKLKDANAELAVAGRECGEARRDAEQMTAEEALRHRYFDALLERVEDSDVADRIERLLGLGAQ